MRSVQGLGPTPTLTFTHYTTNKDLWTAGACGEDAAVIRKILENVESRGYKAGELYR